MLAQVVRSGFAEAFHHGAVAVVDSGGGITHRFGEIDLPFFVRSAAKPFQAAVTLALGGPMSPEEIAISTSSHDADPVHTALVEQILDAAGLSEADLECPPGWPGSSHSARALALAGNRRPRRIWHNCSGKHAGMLRACVAQGWPTGGYTDPQHPIQTAITTEMVDIFGPGALPVGIDGCGAPVFRSTVTSLASAFARLVADDRYGRVVDAMSRFPALTSGARHPDLPIAVWLGGVAKRGAEGCLGVGLPGRGGLAVKVWDGAERAVAVAAVAALDAVGWIPDGARRNLESELCRPVFGGGEIVGTVEPAFELERV